MLLLSVTIPVIVRTSGIVAWKAWAWVTWFWFGEEANFWRHGMIKAALILPAAMWLVQQIEIAVWYDWKMWSVLVTNATTKTLCICAAHGCRLDASDLLCHEGIEWIDLELWVKVRVVLAETSWTWRRELFVQRFTFWGAYVMLI